MTSGPSGPFVVLVGSLTGPQAFTAVLGAPKMPWSAPFRRGRCGLEPLNRDAHRAPIALLRKLANHSLDSRISENDDRHR